MWEDGVAVAVQAVVLLLVGFLWKELTMGICTCTTTLQGKVAVITGGTSGIGLQTTLQLAARGATVVAASRSKLKGEEAIRRIREETGNKRVDWMELDTASLSSVRKFSEELQRRYSGIHILVNNAGIGSGILRSGQKSMTMDNLECVMQTNYLGHFLLTNLLRDFFDKSWLCRVVNVSSMGHLHGKIDISNINSEKSWRGSLLYGDTKLMNVLFAKELARRWRRRGVLAFSLHPGWVRSNFLVKSPLAYILHPLSFLLGKSCSQGAMTIIHLCASNTDRVLNNSGSYWSDCRLVERPFYSAQADDECLRKTLWERSEKLCGLRT